MRGGGGQAVSTPEPLHLGLVTVEHLAKLGQCLLRQASFSALDHPAYGCHQRGHLVAPSVTWSTNGRGRSIFTSGGRCGLLLAQVLTHLLQPPDELVVVSLHAVEVGAPAEGVLRVVHRLLDLLVRRPSKESTRSRPDTRRRRSSTGAWTGVSGVEDRPRSAGELQEYVIPYYHIYVQPNLAPFTGIQS